MEHYHMRIIPFLSLITLSLFTTIAHAGLYIGGAAGKSDFSYSDIDDGSSKKFYIGYKPKDNHFAVELASVDSGDADIEDGFGIFNSSIRVEGWNLSAVYNTAANLGQDEPFNVFIKLGYYSVDTDIDTNISDLSEDSSGLSFGVGLEYAITNNFILRADIEGLSDVEDFADDETVTLASIGVQFQF